MDGNFEVEDIVMNWFPNCSDMLKTTLGNKNMVYYPYNSNNCELKAFDFVSTKGLAGDDDDFISIEKEQNLKQKSKTNKRNPVTTQNKKTNNTTYHNKKYEPKKLKVTQSITPDTTWSLITESNKQLLEKVRYEGTIQIEDR